MPNGIERKVVGSNDQGGNDQMSELAFNANGDGFEVPAIVTGWRVRRMKPRGAPELVYGRDGRPLTVPIECDMDDLRGAVTTLGRYRLDPVDDNGRVIDGVPAAYVQVSKPEREVPEATVHLSESDSVLKEAMRLNTDLAKAVVDRFPEMMNAAAELLRAADGAGLPARRLQLVHGEDEDDGDDEESIAIPAGFDLNTFVAQIVPVLLEGLASGKMKMPALGQLLDWRKASPANDSKEEPPREPPAKRRAKLSASESKNTELPPLDPSMMAHFVAIQSALSTKEAELARELASALEPTELRVWIEDLSKLSVPDAAAKIRKVVTKAGGDE